jgi:hypothetical protein
VVEVAGEVGRAEGRGTWLVVLVLALVFLVVPVWVRYGGSASGSLPATPANPVAILGAGQKIAFAHGDLAVGDGLVCQASGMVVGAAVPKPGHTKKTRLVNANDTATATITVQTKDDGVVIARCS